MGGGLLQLVAYGAQDVYLTGNPQITFFKVAYRRHTNFALEAIEQTFNGNANYGSRVTCQISRNGDLIHRIYLQVTLPPNPATNITGTGADYNYYNYFGLRLLNYVEIEIGGQKIDKHYAHWLYVWNELSLPRSKSHGYNQMVGAYGTANLGGSTLYIPLEFWFCRNIGLALPLIALQYHEVKININFESASNCLYTTSSTLPTLSKASLWVDYIYLDTDERRRFAQLSHEYLIEQLQFTGTEAITGNGSAKIKLNFNHPCKELVWFVSNPLATNSDRLNWCNFTTSRYALGDVGFITANTASYLGDTYDKLSSVLNHSDVDYSSVSDNYKKTYNFAPPCNPVSDCKLVLNGNDRFYQRSGKYFNLIQPFQHHTNVPSNAGINVYSFALKPEEHQPSGTLNMSRIDTAILNINFEAKSPFLEKYNSTGTTITTIAGKTPSETDTPGYDSSTYNIYVYAVNYNVLRILSGMGGLAYSN